MKYKIAVYQDESTEIAMYTSASIPRIGESLYFPHRGTFQVTDVIYHVSDDLKEFENELMFVVINIHHVDERLREETCMKYIFLDINGVLNNNSTLARSPDGFAGISSILGKRLRKLIEQTHARVVLTSSWKDNSSSQDYQYLIRKLKMQLAVPVAKIQEPEERMFLRGAGINAFLEEHRCEQFVILDDFTFDFKEEGLFPHLVLTDPEKGLTEEDATKAIDILNGNLLSANSYDELLM